jgi:SecDF, P1 head subdomain
MNLKPQLRSSGSARCATFRLQPHVPIIVEWNMTSLPGRALVYAAMLLLLQGALPVPTSAEEIIVLSVASARVDHDVRTGKPHLAIKLDEASRRTFSTFSSTYVGSKTELRVDGKVIAEPVIREPITGGSLHIDLDDQTETANTLAEQLSRPGAKVEVVLSK